MPPASRNHLVPTADATPTATAASSLEAPLAISTQNLCRWSRCHPGGAPGERILPRIGHVAFCCLVTPIAQHLPH